MNGKKLSLLSSTARLGSVPYFVKTGNTVKWGKKIRFSKLAQKIRLVIYQTLYLLSLMKNHTQERKLEAFCALGGLKYDYKTIFNIYDPFRCVTVLS